MDLIGYSSCKHPLLKFLLFECVAEFRIRDSGSENDKEWSHRGDCLSLLFPNLLELLCECIFE